MFLDFAGTLVNLDHVAQVEPYAPGAGKRLTVILSNGNRVGVKDGDDAVRIYRSLLLSRVSSVGITADGIKHYDDAGNLVDVPKPPKKGKAK